MSGAKRPSKAKYRSLLDRAFFALVTIGWGPREISDYRNQLKRHTVALAADVTDSFQLIDVKATGLLTHVSLMIAGLGLIAPLVADNQFEKGIVVAEIGVYLLVAVGCLRCLSVFHTHEFDANGARLREIADRELILRRELYRLCNRAAIVFTILVFLILPALFLYRPGA